LAVNENRHCLESYFTDPQEIESALLAKDRRLYTPRIATIREHIESQRAAWVDHWSLWVTMSRVSSKLGAESFPGFFHDQYALPADAEIRHRLEVWASVVDSNAAFEAFATERARARLESPSDQYRSCIYAKKFYPTVVVQSALNPLGPSNGRSWMLKLAKWLPSVPRDIAPILKFFLSRRAR
jgi:hypothetical protein